MSPSRVLNALSLWCVYAVAVLTPVFFLPITNEPLELNKHYLLGFLTVLGLLAWLASCLIERKLVFVRTAFDLPLLAFWLITLLASILSEDRLVSFFGPYENLSWGFLPLTFYLLLFFLTTQHVQGSKTARRLVYLLVFGSALAALYYLVRLFWSFSIGDVSLPRWNTVASLNGLFAISLVPALVIAFSFLLNKRSSIGRTIVWAVLALLLFAAILTVGQKTVWIAAALALGLLLVVTSSRLNDVRYSAAGALTAMFVAALIFLILGTPRFLSASLPLEVNLSQKTSTAIVWESLREGVLPLLFGNGPATFVYAFSAHRPEALNQTFAWAVRFREPSSSALDVLGGSGLIGGLLFALILLVGAGTFAVVWIRQTRTSGNILSRRRAERSDQGSASEGERDELVTLFFGVAVAWILLAVMFFFVHFRTVPWVFFFLLLALLAIVGGLAGRLEPKIAVLSLRATPQFAFASSFLYIVLLATVVIGTIFLGRFYAGEVAYAQAVRTTVRGDYDQALQHLTRVTAYNPYRSEYFVSFAQVYLLRAAEESRKEAPDPAKISEFVGLAVNQARAATELSPKSAEAWETLAAMYENIRSIAPEANGWALKALEQAIVVESTNPTLFLKRAGAYRFVKQNESAKFDYQKAIALKPDYAIAHYGLALLLEESGDLEGALQTMLVTVNIVPNDVEVIYSVGRLYYNRNKADDALKAEAAFRHAIELNPSYSNARYSLGLLLERKGRDAEALEQYRRVAELNPENEEVRRRIRAVSAE